MMSASVNMIAITLFISSLAWQSCWGLSCYSCSTIVDNGVSKPGNQTCALFHSATESEKRTKFVEACPSGVKACSHSEKRGFVGQSSGSSYDIIQKGCYGRSFVNVEKFNQCEDIGGGGGGGDGKKRERLCLCDTDLCLMDPGKVVQDEGRKSGANGKISPVLSIIFLNIAIFARIV